MSAKRTGPEKDVGSWASSDIDIDIDADVNFGEVVPSQGFSTPIYKIMRVNWKLFFLK